MRHVILSAIGTVFGIFLFILTIIVLLMVFGVFGAIAASFAPKPTHILSMDLRMPMSDHQDSEAVFGPDVPSIVDTVRKLEQAKDDKTIKGVFIRADTFGMAPASAEELRLALLDFQTSGKFVIAHAQGFESTSILPYQAVSAATEIWMQDTTGFAVSGLRSESEFYGGVMEKLDAQPQFEKFAEYKNAVNTYTEIGYTEPHREAVTSYLTSLYDNAVTQIAEDRDLTPASLEQVLKSSPHTAEDAKAAGMIDTLGHLEAAKTYAKKKAGGDDVKFMSLTDYTLTNAYSSTAIAFIGGEGGVVPGSSSSGSFFGGSVNMGGDTLAKAFDDATKDDSVKAIVFRVSSPGGSAAASDQILAAADRAQEAGKPVIISMGQYAASGGYYVAAKADHIVAMPQTITGSIGVFGGKVALEDTFAKIGYNLDSITVGGDYSGVYSVDTPFTESQRAAYRQQMRDIYDDFLERVADGRDMSVDEVHAIAKGRVWTGTQAKENGLVDELGGYKTALAAARRLAEIDEDEDVYIKRFPRAKSFEEQIMSALSGSAQMREDMATLREIMNMPEVKAAMKLREIQSREGRELEATLPEIR